MAANALSRSVVDNLPEAERKRVIDSLLAGEALRKVASTINVSHVALSNYKRKVLLPSVKAAQKLNAIQELAQTPQEQAIAVTTLTRASLQAAPFVERINKHRATVDAKMAEADGRTAASLISADLKGLELEARITGLLDGPSHATVNNLVVIMSPKCEEVEPALTPSPQAIDTTCEPSESDE